MIFAKNALYSNLFGENSLFISVNLNKTCKDCDEDLRGFKCRYYERESAMVGCGYGKVAHNHFRVGKGKRFYRE